MRLELNLYSINLIPGFASNLNLYKLEKLIIKLFLDGIWQLT